MKNKISRIRKILTGAGCIAAVCAAFALIISAGMVCFERNRILTPDEVAERKDTDCILVLGCAVYGRDVPSQMLADRLKRGVELYDMGAAPKLLMSGDHGSVYYNEVGTMKDYAVQAGVPSSDVFTDHAGFSTYDSMYRARDIFRARKIIIVTQRYHLYRALFIARALGLDAYGVSSDYQTYAGQSYREVREIAARDKAFAYCIFKPAPSLLGNAVPISGDGDVTDD